MMKLVTTVMVMTAMISMMIQRFANDDGDGDDDDDDDDGDDDDDDGLLCSNSAAYGIDLG